MKNYKYIARDFTGQRREGLKQAASSSDVVSWLRQEQLTPVSVQELSGTTNERPKRGRRRKIKSADLAALCWQLTTMVEGGIPITSAIETIAEDVDNLRLRKILEQILQKMQRGKTLSESLAEFPEVFNQLTRAIVMAGETGGALPESLRRLAGYFESRDRLKKKIQGAMAYPAFVFCFVVLIVIFIMTFIIPRFKKVFTQFGGELPGFTKGFMAFYDAVRMNVAYIVAFAFLAVIAMVLVNKTSKGHHIFCRIALGFPLLGKVLSQGFIAIFCRTMSTLVSAGVSVLEVFDILATMTGNTIIKSALVRTRERIVGGASISLSLSTSGFFPNLVVKMMQVGEESGAMSRVLDRTADYYERKVDSTIKTVMSLIEPIMIVTVGVIVLVVVFALYLPIFTMK